MANVELKNICKVYPDGVTAVDNVNLYIKDKEFVVLVGPSGCGKSTTLRMVAGLEDISSGDLMIDGERMNDTEPKDRNIAMVFQNYALYPHMTVYENMAFALRIKNTPKEEIHRRVMEAARILDIEEYLKRKPKALSGGQRQRVAVGRSIVRQPKVFLFDEPLSNLDAKLRVQMRAEIIALHKRLSATMIYVTHDQIEAMTMGDKIVVMKNGVVQQIGSPLFVYNYPINKFVAGFIGSPPMNFVRVRLEGHGDDIHAVDSSRRIALDREHAPFLKDHIGEEIIVGIRPEDFMPVDREEDAMLEGEITMSEPLGGEINLHLRTPSGDGIVAIMDPEHDFSVGQRVLLAYRLNKLKFFDVKTENSLLDKEFYKSIKGRGRLEAT
jgi:multiple sugar transport system ATP-binding protein